MCTVLLFCVLFVCKCVLYCCSMYCLCVNVYCTAATGCQPTLQSTNISHHIPLFYKTPQGWRPVTETWSSLTFLMNCVVLGALFGLCGDFKNTYCMKNTKVTDFVYWPRGAFVLKQSDTQTVENASPRFVESEGPWPCTQHPATLLPIHSHFNPNPILKRLKTNNTTTVISRPMLPDIWQNIAFFKRFARRSSC